jgi:hypothetical protein
MTSFDTNTSGGIREAHRGRYHRPMAACSRRAQRTEHDSYGDRQQHHGTHATHRREGRDVCLSPFRGGERTPAPVSPALSRDARQLGSRCHRSARGGARGHSGRQRRYRTFDGDRPHHDRGDGRARIRVPGCSRHRELRRARVLARRHDRAANGARSSLDLSPTDSGGHGAARRRGHHASREASPRETSPGLPAPRLPGAAKNLLRSYGVEPSGGSGIHRPAHPSAGRTTIPRGDRRWRQRKWPRSASGSCLPERVSPI